MKLLLDTHVFIWWRNKQRRLRAETAEAIAVAEIVFVSLASAWEATIKASLGRIELGENFRDGVRDAGFAMLAIEFAHVERIAGLPHLHRDPFDRILVAQSLVENLTIVTDDAKIVAYGTSSMSAL